MAMIFEMWVQCESEAGTKQLANHFLGSKHTLLNGRTINWDVEITDRPGELGVVIASGDLSGYGVRTVQDVLETTEAGLHLYHHLKSGPDFRFARVAWEAEGITLGELPEYVETFATDKKRLGIECAIDDVLFRQLEVDSFCFPFRKNYWWTRYKGETYEPLYSNDQIELNSLCRKLFPEYFSY